MVNISSYAFIKTEEEPPPDFFTSQEKSQSGEEENIFLSCHSLKNLNITQKVEIMRGKVDETRKKLMTEREKQKSLEKKKIEKLDQKVQGREEKELTQVINFTASDVTIINKIDRPDQEEQGSKETELFDIKDYRRFNISDIHTMYIPKINFISKDGKKLVILEKDKILSSLNSISRKIRNLYEEKGIKEDKNIDTIFHFEEEKKYGETTFLTIELRNFLSYLSTMEKIAKTTQESLEVKEKKRNKIEGIIQEEPKKNTINNYETLSLEAKPHFQVKRNPSHKAKILGKIHPGLNAISLTYAALLFSTLLFLGIFFLFFSKKDGYMRKKKRNNRRVKL